MSDRLKISNAWICPIDDENIHPQFGDVIIESGLIADIHFRSFSGSMDVSETESQINAGGRVLSLPNINFHEHIYSRLARGLPVAGPMNNFIQILENMWWALDGSLDMPMINACAQLTAHESIRMGVTYLFDHHASPNACTNSLSTIANALDEFGLRSVLSFEASDRNGSNVFEEALNETENFFQSNSNNNIKVMMGLHAPFTLSDTSLELCRKLMNKLDIAIHTHVSEDRHDLDFCQKNYQMRPVERLKKYDLLSDRSILTHGIHLTPEEYATISETGCVLVYCPDSNLNNAVGLPAYLSVPEDIPVLAGTDGMHANIAKSIKQLFLLSRMQGNDFTSTFNWIKKIYMDQIRFVKQWFSDFPGLHPGDRADFILWDYIPPTPLNTENFWGHYIYGILESPVYSVFQNGTIRMHAFAMSVPENVQTNEFIYLQGQNLYQKMKALV